jgi:hypothetical protein
MKRACNHVRVSNPEDEDDTTFFRMSLSDDEGDESPVVSRAAFQLHAFAMNNSMLEGTPGFIPDDYLNAISAETTVTAMELCMVGLWKRDDSRGGYDILDPMMHDVVEMHEQLARSRRECEATGGHETNEEFGPDICCKCGAPIDPEAR